MDKTFEEFERALRLSQFTIEQSPDAVLWVDSDARICRVNAAACQLLGYAPNELLGATAYTFHLQEDREAWQKRWDRIKREKLVVFERVQPTKEGQLIPVEVRSNFIEVQGEEYTCSFLRNLSRQKQAEEDLQESQRQLKTLINNLPGAVYRCRDDRFLTMEFITDWSTRITGYAPEDAIQNRRIAKIDMIHPEDRQKVLQHVREALHERKPGKINYRIITADNEITWISDRFRGVYSEEGTVLAIEGFFNDITPQMESEQKLVQALLEVEHLKNRLEEENIYLRQEIKLTYNFENILAQSAPFKQVLTQVEQVAATDATVLILGETGTGKELIARAVHNLSARQRRPLVKVNCAALPANLIESELFGHEKGSFTGAIARKIGRFELADSSSIFLDEIGELPMDLQVKLLRVLQESEFERLGNPQTIKVNVRVIAATNRNLEKAVEEGTFREDLFYRLNVFPIQLPPLRERPDDIPLLVKHFVQKFSKKTGKPIEHVPRKVMESLQAYHWPGNVRELENIIERAVILSHGKRLKLGKWFTPQGSASKKVKIAPLQEVERTHILKALKQTSWRVSGEHGAAVLLGMNAQTLVSRMKKLKIHRPK